VNAQQIFDKVALHLITQGCPAFGEEGECAYRGTNGTSCAVGCLIPDQAYDIHMEGRPVERIIQRFPDRTPGYFREHASLLTALQLTHDDRTIRKVDQFYNRVFDLDLLREKLAGVAEDFDLNTEVLA